MTSTQSPRRSPRRYRVASLCALGCLVAGGGAGARITAGDALAAPTHATSFRASHAPRLSYDSLPLVFEAGQGDRHDLDGVRFTARGGGYNLFLTPRGAVLLIGGAAPPRHSAARPSTMSLRFVGANVGARLDGENPRQETVSYMCGGQAGVRSRRVATYTGVSYKGVYPGVDLRYYGTQGHIEYDLNVAPGAAARQIVERVDGAQTLRLDARGDLDLQAANGDSLRLRAPAAYQMRDGRRLPVAVSYVLAGSHTFSFRLGRYDVHRPLVVDPVLSYSTFFGSNSVVNGIALDPSGGTYIAGYTYSTIITSTKMLQLNRVPTNCPSNSTNPCADAFVAKFAPGQSRLIYTTYLGGSNNDVATGIAVTPGGGALVTGYTSSLDFPVTAHAFQKTNHGGNDVFVTKLSPNGLSLLYSTYLGGSIDNADTVGDDVATGIAVDGAGDAFVTGYTYAYNFPLKNPLQGALGFGKGTLGTQIDAFVTKFNPTGSALLYSTYLGGSLSDTASGIAIDGAGDAYITGQTNSPDFPAPAHALQPQLFGTDFNSFVLKLNPSGKSILFSTYFGKTAADKTHGIAVDGAGDAFVVGETNGGIPRTIGVVQPASGGGIDAFVTKFNARGVLVYSTYLGGIGNDVANAVALDRAGDAYVTGSTGSASFNTPLFPLQGALQGSLGGNRGGFGMLDAFVAKLNSCGSNLLYSSYLGGTFVDGGNAIVVNGGGDAFIAGQTLSPNFPIANSTRGGAVYAPPTADAFVARISKAPGNTSGACAPSVTIDAPPTVSITGPLTVTVHTVPFAQVSATLVITNSVAPTPGAPVKQPKLGAVIYSKSVHGGADSFGLFRRAIPLTFKTAAPIPATVRVVVKSGRFTLKSSVPVLVGP